MTCRSEFITMSCGSLLVASADFNAEGLVTITRRQATR